MCMGVIRDTLLTSTANGYKIETVTHRDVSSLPLAVIRSALGESL